jgi:large subunit ribosomal protein L32
MRRGEPGDGVLKAGADANVAPREGETEVPVPKKRKSPAKRDRRRAHHDKVTPKNLTYCTNPECGAPVLQHHVCPECGQYKGEAVIQVVTVEEVEAKKKEKREKVKAAKAGRETPEKEEKKEKDEDEDDEDKK